jgi:hypothetical protein
MILPGETEAGTAGTQPCRGISRWAHRDDERGRSCAAQPPSDRKTPCLENPRPKGGILTNGERRLSRLNQDTKAFVQFRKDLRIHCRSDGRA